eukprot:scaffold56774_cov67-Phaeocystis_antarctica.AAC.5
MQAASPKGACAAPLTRRPKLRSAGYHPSDGAPLVLEALLDEQCAVTHRDTRHHRLLQLLSQPRVALQEYIAAVCKRK